MTSQANSAKNDDFGHICKEMASWTKTAKDSKTKADRGFNKKEYARHLTPPQLIAQFDLDCEACVLSMYFLDLFCLRRYRHCAPLGTHFFCVTFRFSEDVAQGVIILSEKQFPSFMYALDKYDPSKLKQGLLESDLIVFVCTPSSHPLHLDIIITASISTI